MKHACFLLFVLYFISIPEIGFGQSDSTLLTYRQLLDHIKIHHPIAKKANLQQTLGEAEILAAKGNLDPKLSSSWNNKEFKDKNYYRKFEGGISIPTQMGIDVVGGYEYSEGVFLNPENITDNNGLWYLGVEVDVLQGLIVNERKTALQQAEVFQQMTLNEQQILLNKLLYGASKSYLNWQQFQAFQEVLEENITLARVYFENTRTSFESGESTAMDTLEAFIQYQDATNSLQKNETFLINAIRYVENFLWFEDEPIGIRDSIFPEAINNNLYDVPGQNIGMVVDSHPQILSYTNERTYYELEQRLNREMLKPKLKLKYNPLLSTTENSLAPNFDFNNYRFGVDFSMPLLFRKEKAQIDKGEITIKELGFDLENKRNEITNILENNLEQQQIIKEQITISQRNLEGYKLLLDGENEKFNFGESSVFLVNRRQEKYINERLKLIELNIKLQKVLLDYYYHSNQLIDL